MIMLTRIGFASALLAAMLALTAVTLPPPAPTPVVTWAKDVAPILYRSCAECHHPGGPGPFSLLTYAEVQPRAHQIAQVTGSRFMPPWLPEPNGVPLAHARRLSDDAIGLIQRWYAQGEPEGNPRDLPSVPQFSDGWRLGAPDQILRMPKPYTLPGETTSPYRCFVLPLALPGRKWLRAIEFHPGNPAVIRHAEIYADATGTARRLEEQSGSAGYEGRDAGLGLNADPLAEWAVGSAPKTYPLGIGERLPAGSDIVLALRFEPDGQRETVQAEVGLYYASQPPSETPVVLTLGTHDLILRPDQKATVVDAINLPVAVRVLRVTPHGHPICRTLHVSANPLAAPVLNLLQINDWDYHWQASYEPAEPPVLPAGTRLGVRWTADDSDSNPRNPSTPPMTVMPGLLYQDEMATVRLELLPVRPQDAPALEKAVRAARPAPSIEATAAHRHG